MKSIDGGQTWNKTGLRYSSNFKTTSEIFIDPKNNEHIWVATTDGLQKSEDGGDNWEIKLSGNIIDFKFKPSEEDNGNTIYAGSYNVVNNSKFHLSTDNGETFHAIQGIPNYTSRIAIEVTPANPNKVYVLNTTNWSSRFDGIYVSEDSGVNFTKTAEKDDIFNSPQVWYNLAFTVDNNDEDKLFVGALDIWRSTDGGDDFVRINKSYETTPSFTHADIHFLRYFNGVLYAGTDGGIYRSTDDGDTFDDLSNTLSIAQVYTLATAKKDSSKIAVGLQDCGGFGLSGQGWSNFHYGDGTSTAVHPFDDNTYYGMTQNGGGLYQSNDGGLNGKIYGRRPAYGGWVTPLEMNKNGDLYAAFNNLYVLSSSLGSGTWLPTSNQFSSSSLFSIIEMDPNDVNTIYIYRSSSNRVYRSTDRGRTFSVFKTLSSVIDIEVHHTDSNKIWLLLYDTLYYSENGGKSYSTYSLASLGIHGYARTIKHQAYSPNNALYIGTTLGVYYTDDTLDGFHSISEYLPNVEVKDMEINSYDNKLTVATYGRGVWQTPIPPVTRPTHDLDILDAKVPEHLNYKSDKSQFDLTIDVYNNGSQEITSFDYEVTINEDSDGLQSITDISIAPGTKSSFTHQIENVPNRNAWNDIEVELSLPNDEYTNNNLISQQFPLYESGVENRIYQHEDNDEEWYIDLQRGTTRWEKEPHLAMYFTNPVQEMLMLLT